MSTGVPCFCGYCQSDFASVTSLLRSDHANCKQSFYPLTGTVLNDNSSFNLGDGFFMMVVGKVRYQVLFLGFLAFHWDRRERNARKYQDSDNGGVWLGGGCVGRGKFFRWWNVMKIIKSTGSQMKIKTLSSQWWIAYGCTSGQCGKHRSNVCLA